LPLKKSGTIAVIGPLADAKEKYGWNLSVATNMDKSISLIAGKRSGEWTNVLYAKGSNLITMLVLRKATMFGKPCIVIELLQN
jgi:beta-glucosidase